MNIRKANRRDRKIDKRKNGIQIDNRSIFLIQEIQCKKSEEIKKAREEKEAIRNGTE